MRRIVIAALLGCSIFWGMACRNHSGSGSAIIPQDTMRVIMWELFEADSYTEFLTRKDSNYRHDTAYAGLYTQIFRYHHVTREAFDASYDYYLSQPTAMKAIIDSLVASREAGGRAGRPGVGTPGPNNRPVMPNGRPVILPNGQHLPPNGIPHVPGHPAAPGARPAGPNGHATGHPTGPNGQPLPHGKLPSAPPSKDSV